MLDEERQDETPNREPAGNANRLVAKSWRTLADSILPPVCPACHAYVDSHDTLCPVCWSGISFIRPPLCDRLGTPMPFEASEAGDTAISAAALANPPDYDRARYVALYEGTILRLIHMMKYNDSSATRRLFAHWLLSSGKTLIAEADMIVPVPLSRGRLLWRRFNQSAELARDIARNSKKLYAPDLLRRRRSTRTQVGLTAQERKANVAGAFEVPPRKKPKIKGARVLLIDDVVTTGATVEACARAMRRAGASSVDVLALARTSGNSYLPQ